MSDRPAEPIPVMIYGRSYPLRGDQDPRYLAELAELVDRRMREIAEATGTADTLKLAVLAALNIADDYLQAGHGRDEDSRRLEERLARMVVMLDEAIAEHAPDPRRA